MPSSGYYLVQRLQRPFGDVDPTRGFDGYFKLDYMGSAEFEFGAVQDSLRAIREAGSLCTIETPIAAGRRRATTYVVGPQAWVTTAASEMQAWVDEGCWSKEAPHFAEQITGTAQEWHRDTIAWWSLTNHIAWALTPEVADQLTTAFSAKKPPRRR